jgi:tetratricopeptide (TPR) repeat protein
MTLRQTLESELDHARNMGDASSEASLLLQLASIAREEEEYALAQGLYGQAWAAYERAGDTAGQSCAMRLICDSILKHRDLEPDFVDPLFYAEAFLRQALEMAHAAHEYEEEGYGLLKLSGVIRLRFDEMDQRWQLVEKALACFERIGNLEAQAEAVSHLAKLASVNRFSKGKTRAIQLYKHAVELYEHTGPSLGKAETLKWYGTQLVESAGYEQGYLYLKQALSIYLKIDLRSETLLILEHMGNIAIKARDYPEAKERFRQALPLCRLYAPEMRSVVDQLANLARVGSDYAQTQAELKLFIKFYEHRNPGFSTSQTEQMGAFKDLAWVNIELGRFEEAQIYNETAKVLCKPHEDPAVYASILHQKALIDQELSGVKGVLRRFYKRVIHALPSSNELY